MLKKINETKKLGGAGERASVLPLTIKDSSVLYSAYLPFLKNGGLFVPTSQIYRIGDEVFLLLDLMDDGNKYHIAGTVAWITPIGANQGKTQGIGVHFSEDETGIAVKNSIERHLASELNSGRRTHTL